MEIDIIRRKVDSFLNKNDAYYETININKLIKNFIKEMNKGLRNEISSLKMIPLNLVFEKKLKIKNSENILVIDAGGTNLRIAIVSLKEQNIVISEFRKYELPGSKEEIYYKDFFRIIGDYIAPFIDNINKIGFCFSYPAEATNNNDGKVISLSKQIKIKEMEGKLLGEELNFWLKKRKKIVVLNDTVATLFSLLAVNKEFSSSIGFVLGTGTNCSFIYNDEKIINIEAGNFDKLNLSKFDNELDTNKPDRGSYVLEKMIAGKYLGELAYILIKNAIDEKVFFSKNANELIKEMIQAEDISIYLNCPFAKDNLLGFIVNEKLEDKKDRIVLFLLFENLIERVAKLSSVVLSAVSLFIQKGENPLYPVGIVADGSTFNKLYKLKERSLFYLNNILRLKHHVYYEVLNVDNAPIIGSAIAAFLN